MGAAAGRRPNTVSRVRAGGSSVTFASRSTSSAFDIHRAWLESIFKDLRSIENAQHVESGVFSNGKPTTHFLRKCARLREKRCGSRAAGLFANIGEQHLVRLRSAASGNAYSLIAPFGHDSTVCLSSVERIRPTFYAKARRSPRNRDPYRPLAAPDRPALSLVSRSHRPAFCRRA